MRWAGAMARSGSMLRSDDLQRLMIALKLLSLQCERHKQLWRAADSSPTSSTFNQITGTWQPAIMKASDTHLLKLSWSGWCGVQGGSGRHDGLHGLNFVPRPTCRSPLLGFRSRC